MPPKPSKPPKLETPTDPPCPGGTAPHWKHFWTVVVRGPWECQRCGYRKAPPGSAVSASYAWPATRPGPPERSIRDPFEAIDD